MTRANWLEGAAAYRRRANAHRPTDLAVLNQEIRRLYREGLRPRDIAGALGIALGVVLEALRGTDSHRACELDGRST